MTVILYLPQRVGITRFDCSQTGFGKQLAFVFSQNTPTHVRWVCVCTLHAWSLHACNDSQKNKKKTGNKSSRHDSPDDSMKLPTCQLVPASSAERRWILSANFRKLRGGWGTLELLSAVQPSQAREARPHPRLSPLKLRVHIFKQTYVAWEIERRRQNEAERWIQQEPE